MFLPSKDGFIFANDPPSSSYLLFGNTNNGICGGMVFSALDAYLGKIQIPLYNEFPPLDSWLFGYLKKRFINSLHLPMGGLKVWKYSCYPNLQNIYEVEIPQILNRLETRPVPIILIKIQTCNPFSLGENHQVLVYKAEKFLLSTRLFIYDPNYPKNDDLFLDCSIDTITHKYDGECFGLYENVY
jgi:hypothetical protein